MSATIKIDGENRQQTISQDAWVRVPANKPYHILGLDPQSQVCIREDGDHEWRRRIAVDVRGALRDAQKAEALATHEQGGEAYEVEVTAGGRATSFRLVIDYVHGFTAQDVEAMLLDLRNAGFRWDRTSPIPTRTGDLARHIRAYQQHVQELHEDFEAIKRAPNIELRSTDALVEAHRVRRFDVTMVRQNVRERRMGPDGAPLTARVRARVGRPSLDTGANAYVVKVIQEAAAIWRELLAATHQERERIESLRRRERRYFAGELPRDRVKQFMSLLAELDDLNALLVNSVAPMVPDAWASFRRSADAGSNSVRFDPRYRRVHERRLALRFGTPADDERLQRIAAFGKRPQNQIYEYWTVAKVLEVLQRMGFGVEEGAMLESNSTWTPLRDLELEAGDSYELVAGRRVHLIHVFATHLSLAVAYEPRIDSSSQSKTFTPDIVVSLRGDRVDTKPSFGDRPYDTRTLMFDAKFRELRTGSETFGYLKRYAHLRAGAQVHLLHLGGLTSWARRATDAEDEVRRAFGVADDGLITYYPYRIGVSQLRPSADAERMRAMLQPVVRVVFAWLVRQGVVCICPRCGGQLEASSTATGQEDARVPFLPAGGAFPKKRHLSCAACGLALTATYCGSCRRKDRAVFTPIIKVYPKPGADTERLPDDWSHDFEIAERTPDYRDRVCPRCGRGFAGGRTATLVDQGG